MSVASIRKLLLASSAVALLAAASAHAEMKIAVVNFQRLGDESPQAKAATQVLQNEFSPRQRELQQKEKDLQTKQEKLQRDGATMTEAERSNLEKELTRNARDLKSQEDSFNEEVNSRRNEELGKLQNTLVQDVQSYAKSNGYDLVLPSSVALYAKDAYDITAQVLSYLGTKPAVGGTPKPAAK